MMIYLDSLGGFTDKPSMAGDTIQRRFSQNRAAVIQYDRQPSWGGELFPLGLSET